MFEGLPKEYDVIIVGTGVTETIVAAACSRIGKSVFQVDINDYYGSEWSGFSLDTFLEWFTSNGIQESTSDDKNDEFLTIADPSHAFKNKQIQWNEQENSYSSESSTTIETLKKQSRRFSIDLAPKLIYATGGLVDLIVQSGVGKYCEYKLVTRLLFERDGKLEKVPSSRADIFNTNDLSLIDKRLLMKVMMNCASVKIDELGEDRDIPFIEYLQKQNLNPILCSLILNSIAMLDSDAKTSEGIKKAKRYLESIGRYGNSPFLHQQYGSGEISQCFSRLCAVFGGIQHLRFPLAGLTIDKTNQRCTGIKSTTGEQFEAKDAVICNHSFVPSMVSYKPCVVERIVLITNQSIKPTTGEEEITFLRLNNTNQSKIHILEIGSGTGCTPSDLFLLYIFHEHYPTVDHSVDQLINRIIELTEGHFNRSNILAQFSFEQVQVQSVSTPLSALFVTSGPDGSIDHDQAIASARAIFQQIYSNDHEFLPTPPDPEDIIIGEENTDVAAEEN